MCIGMASYASQICFTWKRRPCSLVSLVSEVQEEELSRELLLPPVGRSWQHFPNIFTWASVLYGVKTGSFNSAEVTSVKHNTLNAIEVYILSFNVEKAKCFAALFAAIKDINNWWSIKCTTFIISSAERCPAFNFREAYKNALLLIK